MGRAAIETKMDSRAARAKLKPRGRPYLRVIGDGLFLAYRRNVSGGAWIVQRYVDGAYVSERFATADDGESLSDGETVLSYGEALDRARQLGPRLGRPTTAADLAMVTVADALNSYISAKGMEEDSRAGVNGAKRRDAKSRLNIHVFVAHPDLVRKKLSDVTAEDLQNWRREREQSTSVASAKRVLAYFRASLNSAAEAHRKRFPGLAEEIRVGFKSKKASAPVAREHQIVPPADIRRLIAAAEDVDKVGKWGGDLVALIVTLAATGARFSQVVRMRVSDLKADKVMVPRSAKGKGEKKKSSISVQIGKDVAEMLKKHVSGREGTDPLFLRPRWRQISVTEWEQYGREPWLSPSELSRPWKKIVKTAGLPAETIPYALRHSSIVRGLEAGLPVRFVAEIHDTSSAMIEAHYAANISDAFSDLAARAVVPLIPEAPRPLRSVG